MDLDDFPQVQSPARVMLAKEERLDILVNNATRMSMPLHKDRHGIPISFGTNFLGPFLFTTELLPLLKKTVRVAPGVRVVHISSRVHLALPSGVQSSSLDDFNRDFGSDDDHQSNRLRYGTHFLPCLGVFITSADMYKVSLNSPWCSFQRNYKDR